MVKQESNQRMSKVVIAGDLIFMSGIVAPAEFNTVQEQVRSELTIIEEFLKRNDSDRSKILSASIFLRDLSSFNELNEEWEKWFEETIPPARTCVQAELASKHALVEITVIATK